MFWIFVRTEAIPTNIKTYVLGGNKNKTWSSLRIILSIKDSLQEQIHFNGTLLVTIAVVVARIHCSLEGVQEGAHSQNIAYQRRNKKSKQTKTGCTQATNETKAKQPANTPTPNNS